MKNGTVAPPCVKLHVEIPSAVKVNLVQPKGAIIKYHQGGSLISGKI